MSIFRPTHIRYTLFLTYSQVVFVGLGRLAAAQRTKFIFLNLPSDYKK